MAAQQGAQADLYVFDEWNEDRLPTAFAGGHKYIIDSQKETVAAVIAAAGVEPGYNVVNIGCGSGIPSLALAKLVGPAGHVTATDPSPVFIEAVQKNASEAGLKNLTAVQSPAAALPFESGRFDAATCLFAVMFFPDVKAGLTRIREVLKPDARAGFVAWGPMPENTMFGSFWSGAGPHLPPDPPPDPSIRPEDIPQPTRFAEAGSLSRRLVDAGFKDVREESRVVELVWPGTAETNFAFWLELTNIEEKIAPERREAFRADVLTSQRRFERDGKLHYSARIVVVSGQA